MSRLKLLRKEKGYTQLKVRMLTGIDQSDYSKMERDIRYPTPDQYKLLAVVLDTSVDYLLELTDEKKPYPRSEKYWKQLEKQD